MNVSTSLNLVIPHKAKDAKTQGKKSKVGRTFGLILAYVFLSLMAILAIFPFYYMIAASFMSNEEVMAGQMFFHFNSFVDNMITNYSETITRLSYWSHVGITLLVAVTTTILQLFVTILSAYAFARMQFKGKDALFMVLLATMMIPGEMLAISNYTTMANLGLISADQTSWQAFLVMVLPLIASVFYIYLLRQNFKQIPNELYLAAKMDGQSDWGFLWKVMVPLCSPTLITIAILSLIGSWNSYVWPSLAVRKDEYQVISVIIRSGALEQLGPNGDMVTQLNWQMAASVLTVVPLLILFIIFRRYIMSGVGRAGIKG